MPDATTPAAFLAALKTQMAARLAALPALADVPVYLVAPAELGLGDWLVLVRDTIKERNELATATRTRSRDETVTIAGAVQGHAASRAGGDDDFQDAFDRAKQIIDELVFELRDNPPSVGRQTRSAIVANVAWTPLVAARGGWVVRGDFDLIYSSRVS